MPARAAGLRPSASHAADAVRPWACAASPDARAIAKPEVITTQLVVLDPPAPVCANAGTARKENIIITNSNITIFRICFSLYELPQWVVDVVLMEANALTLKGSCQLPVPSTQNPENLSLDTGYRVLI